jgi:ADP-glucose pyrophosphorylase
MDFEKMKHNFVDSQKKEAQVGLSRAQTHFRGGVGFTIKYVIIYNQHGHEVILELDDNGEIVDVKEKNVNTQTSKKAFLHHYFTEEHRELLESMIERHEELEYLSEWEYEFLKSMLEKTLFTAKQGNVLFSIYDNHNMELPSVYTEEQNRTIYENKKNKKYF